MLPHAPLQRKIEDVPVIELYINGGADSFLRVMARKKKRERVISAGSYKGVPLTPPDNPQSGPSFHIVRLVCSESPDFVEFLISDANLYLVAYRTCTNGSLSEWFHFLEEEKMLPQFLTKTKRGYKELRFDIAHNGNTTIPQGPYIVLRSIFYALLNPSSTNDQIQQALLRAVILFCEFTRLKDVEDDLTARMKNTEWGEDTIPPLLWMLIRKWSKLSKCALDAREKSGITDPKLISLLRNCGITDIDEVVGPQGQLRLILHNNRQYQSPRLIPSYPATFQDRFPEEDEVVPDDEDMPLAVQGRDRRQRQG